MISAILNTYESPISITTPVDLSNLEFWYSIPKLTGLVEGNLITTITDFSGRGKHLSLQAGRTRGTYKENIINGFPSMLTAGATGYVPPNGNSDTDFLHQGDNTTIWLFKTTSTAYHTLFDSSNFSTSNIGRRIDLNNSNAFSDIIYNGTTTVYNNPMVAHYTFGIYPDNWMIVVTKLEQVKSLENGTVEVNGVLRCNASITGELPQVTATQPGTFFYRSGNGARMHFVEGIGYSRALSDIELNRIIGGIKSNYNI